VIAAPDRAAVAQFLTRLLRLDARAVVRLRPRPAGYRVGTDRDGTDVKSTAGLDSTSGLDSTAGSVSTAAPDSTAGSGSAAGLDSTAGSVWVMLPFRVLVSRSLTVAPPADITVAAADLVAWLQDPDRPTPARCDEAWRWPLPPSPGRVVERIPAAEVARLAEAAARTVRMATVAGVGGRPVGERVLRDALLDHVAIVVTTDDQERIEIPQRMIQGLVRAGLLADPAGVSTDTPRADLVTVRRAMAWIGLSSRYGSAWYRPISPLRLT
jgi:hypothetical protein